jgi:hypothetical protein
MVLGLAAWMAAGDVHSLAGALADQVSLEFGDDGKDLQEHPGERVVPVVDRAARAKRTPRAEGWPRMSSASGADRASRSSLVTVRVSPSRAAARAWSGRAGRGWCRSAKGTAP